MKKLKSIKLCLVIACGFGLMGCAGKSIAINKTESELTQDKSKAYIVFSRPYSFLGAGNSIDIVDFNNKTFEPKYVAYLSAGEQVIYEVGEGEKYFFTDVGANENIQVINAKIGQVYYLNLGVSKSTIFFPKLYLKRRLEFAENLKHQKCTDSFLSKYLFEPKNNAKDGKNISYSSALQFNIECNNENIVDIKDSYYGHTLSELKEPTITMPNEWALRHFELEKEQYTEDIKAYYPIWDSKLRDMPITEDTFLDIKQIVLDSDYKQYNNVKIIASIDSNITSKNEIENFNNSLREKFNNTIGQNKTLTIEYKINKLDAGNQAGRYLTMGIAKNQYKSNIGAIDLDVLFKNDDRIIGSIRLTEVELGGIAGGFNTLNADVINTLYKYTMNNFIQ